MSDFIDFKFSENKSNSFLGGNPVMNNKVDTKLNFICQIDLKDFNVDKLPKKGIMYFYYDLSNNINYDLNNKNRCMVFYENKFFKKEYLNNINIKKNYLEKTNDSFIVRLLGNEVSTNFHKENIELLDRKYDLSKNPKILNYVLEDVKNKCEEWILLLQINSNESIKIGDMGALYYYIKKRDLVNLDFSNVYCIKESF